MMLSYFKEQFDLEKRLLLIVIALAVVLVLATALQPWVDPRWLYMDAQSVGELSGDCCHIYDGAMSMLGIMLWFGTSAISVLACLVFLYRSDLKGAWFSAHASLVSAILALDDAFLLHDVAFPNLGIPQAAVIGFIGVLILSYLWLQRHFFGAPYRWLLAISLSGFAMSVGIDQVMHSIETFWIVAEDGPKFLGIVTWFLLHLMVLTRRLVDLTE
ncbi:MAG: hypothetical protein HRT80_02695 [Henriciella sp.]|nr:hypothetical protein [Henriciella sp.]